MRLYLVLDETRFYQPDFVAEFLKRTKDTIVGAALVTRVPKRNNISYYLLKHWYYLTWLEKIRLLFQEVKSIVLDVGWGQRRGKFGSVRSALEYYKVDILKVQDSINKPKYLSQIRNKDVDVIISSNSLYFGNEILRIPKKCSLNRHSALLPSYGGLWPVFQAFRRGEVYTGASIHVMSDKIDQGKVLSQIKIPIKKGDTLASLYAQCFRASVDVLLEALDKVRAEDFSEVGFGQEMSYYSFPTKEHWVEFRQRGGRFI